MNRRKKKSIKSIPNAGGPAVKRKAVAAAEGHVRRSELDGLGPLPLCIEPEVEGLELAGWVSSHGDELRRELESRGAVLFRGFDLPHDDALEPVIEAASDGLLEYSYRSTPRTRVQGRVYTSTEYPAEQTIPMHNEMSYGRSWPMRIWFQSVVTADEGGETPLADSRRVYREIDPAVRDRFAETGVMYVRNYGGGVDLSWQEVFNTEDRAEVERFAAEHGIELEWKDDDGLRTRQVCQGVARHPRTGEAVWFNQAHLFHVSSVEAEMRRALLAQFAEEDLPRNAYHGDGSPIDDAELAEIRRAFGETQVAFPWQPGDVLALDNMLVAHGRRPFRGERKVLVGMAEPQAATDEVALPGGVLTA